MFALNRARYYADFALMPAIVLLLLASNVGLRFVLVTAAGFALWSLAEYIIHRFAFHHLPWLRLEHDRHHADPAAYIGAGSAITISAFAVLWALAVLVVGGTDADAGTLGFIIGYLVYIVVHDQFHHARLAAGDFLYPQFHRHALHHRGLASNFGVTTPLWDLVFMTYHR
jgi:dihydroceramide fatty acyl 2-hydroxylase